MQREKLGSRLGFILLSAGCAIGCGNVWKFPWMAGQYGGGAFVAIYLLFLIILGLPVMITEFAVGRASQQSPIKMFKIFESQGVRLLENNTSHEFSNSDNFHQKSKSYALITHFPIFSVFQTRK